jgi:large conductance mechanosensitive channel
MFARMVRGFRDFILRGNVVDLAIAVVIGAAFTAVVTAVVNGLVTPLIAAIVGKPNFDALTFDIGKGHFLYGTVLTALISFLSVAAVLYFFVVQPMNALQQRRKSGEPVDELMRACPECLSDIPRQARRCAFCTAQITPEA